MFLFRFSIYEYSEKPQYRDEKERTRFEGYDDVTGRNASQVYTHRVCKEKMYISSLHALLLLLLYVTMLDGRAPRKMAYD